MPSFEYLREFSVFKRCAVCRREIMPHNLQFHMIWQDVTIPRRARKSRTYASRQYKKYDSVNACSWCIDTINNSLLKNRDGSSYGYKQNRVDGEVASES